MKAESRPRVAFLSQYFYPEENTTSWLMSELAFSLSDEFEIVAVAGQPTYHKELGKERVPAKLEKNNVEILRVASTKYPRQKALGRIINTLTFTVSTALKVMTLPRIECILAVTNPPLLHWIAALAGMLRGIPVILLIHDQYPEIISALGKLPRDSVIIRLWKCITRWAYRRAAVIVSLGRCMTERIQQDYPETAIGKTVTIPNWDDAAKIQPMPREKNPLLDEWNLRDRFVVLYAGNIGLFHEIKTVVDAACLLKETEVSFVFVGDGGQCKWLACQIRERGLDNMRVLPFRSREDMPLVLTACDAGLITLKDEATGLCVPSKLYGTLASGKPILCVMNSQSETARTVQEAQCGEVVSPGNPEKLAATLRDWAERPGKIEAMGVNARQEFEARYTQPIITGRYRAVLRDLLKTRKEKDRQK